MGETDTGAIDNSILSSCNYQRPSGRHWCDIICHGDSSIRIAA